MADPAVPAAPASSKALVCALSVALIIVAVIAGVFTYKYFQAAEENATLTAQLEDAQKQINELQPLADKARTMPLAIRIDRHALNVGYNLFAFNRARESLRFQFTVNGSKKFGRVIDGGRFWVLKGLASGDVVKIDSEGYDSKSVTIQ